MADFSPNMIGPDVEERKRQNDLKKFQDDQTYAQRVAAAGEHGLGAGKYVNYDQFKEGEAQKRAMLTFIGGDRVNARTLGDNPNLERTKVDPQLLAQRQALLSQQMQGRSDQMGRQNMAAQQQADEAIKRRFASMGQGNSGAALQMQLQNQQQMDAQQAAATQAMMNEGQGQQLNFQNAAEEAQAGRDMATNQQNYQAELARRLYNNQTLNQNDWQNEQMDFNRAQAVLDKDVTDFNRGTAQKAAGAGGK